MKRKRSNTGHEAAAAMKAKGVAFLKRMGKMAGAKKLEAESVESYAKRKGLADGTAVAENPRKILKNLKKVKKPRQLRRSQGRKGKRGKKRNSLASLLTPDFMKPKWKRGRGLFAAKKKPRSAAPSSSTSSGPSAASKWSSTSRANRERFLLEAGSLDAKAQSSKSWASLPAWLRSSMESTVRGNPKAKSRRVKKRQAVKRHARRKKNNTDVAPAESQKAAKMFKDFHGRGTKGELKIPEMDYHRGNYTKLGNLEYLITELNGKKQKIDFPEGSKAILACDPDGNQLYVLGPAEDTDITAVLGRWDTDKSKDFIDLGDCCEVQYYTRKGFDNFVPVHYYHELGEESGVRPRLMFNRLNRSLHFIGGEYEVRKEKGGGGGSIFN